MRKAATGILIASATFAPCVSPCEEEPGTGIFDQFDGGSSVNMSSGLM